ncbi:hypothetical protein PVAP13_2NG128600 [Panicum virgatum]|uniref:Uncharacterized protein n=1 Tax=Panicum virgatum TaxID=38727 RepID=A0A8T0VEC7_PANVG|nr:hypothetical protein PVAP13_2NG128600 [Panicum virgatum]
MLTFFEPQKGWAANRTSGPGLGLLLLMSLPHNSFGTRIQLYHTNQVLFRSWPARSCLRPPRRRRGKNECASSSPTHPRLPGPLAPPSSALRRPRAPRRPLPPERSSPCPPVHRQGVPSVSPAAAVDSSPPPLRRYWTARGGDPYGPGQASPSPLLHPVRNPNLSWLLGRIAPRPVPRDRSFREL